MTERSLASGPGEEAQPTHSPQPKLEIMFRVVDAGPHWQLLGTASGT